MSSKSKSKSKSKSPKSKSPKSKTNRVTSAVKDLINQNRTKMLLTEKLQKYNHKELLIRNYQKDFEMMMKDKDCRRIYLPNFSPLHYERLGYIFWGTNFESAILSNFGWYIDRTVSRSDNDSKISNFRFLSCNLSKAKIDNAGNSNYKVSEYCWRQRKNCCYFDINGCNLNETNLSGLIGVLSLYKCIAERSNFSNSDIAFWPQIDYNFAECNLKDANFTNVKLTECGFEDCNLDGADFSMAHFIGNCKFKNCSLKGAKFSGAILGKTVFEKCQNLDATSFDGLTEWSTDFYDKKCANDLMNPEDPNSKVKMDPISYEELKKGKNMVVLRRSDDTAEVPEKPSYCYNRKDLEKWLKNKKTNPLTNEKINMDQYDKDNGNLTRPVIITGGKKEKTHKIKKFHYRATRKL